MQLIINGHKVTDFDSEELETTFGGEKTNRYTFKIDVIAGSEADLNLKNLLKGKRDD